VRRHLLTLAAASTSIALIYSALGFSPEWWPDRSYGPRAEDVHWKLSVATGSTAVLLLGTTLCIGPIRRFRSGRAGPVHLPTRRVIGVWSAVVAWVHVVFGVTIHAAGWRIWVPFTHLWESQGKLRILAAAMFLGLSAALTLAIVAAASNSHSLRRLGARRWKHLQRLTYVAAGLIALHVIGMQIQEDRDARHAGMMIAGLLTVAGIQVAGVVYTRRNDLARPRG